MARISVIERLAYLLAGAGIGILIFSLFVNSPQHCSSIPHYGKSSIKPQITDSFPDPEFTKYGYPGPISDIRNRLGYITSYNRMLRNPNFSLEVLTRESLIKHNSTRKHSRFRVDPGIPEVFQAKLSDYRRSGYDRGHMVPSADLRNSQDAMDETFFLSNMAPQVGAGFNRGYWALLEEYCRGLTNTFAQVYIISGPLYLPTKGSRFPKSSRWYVQYEVIGSPPNIAVPTHFYKVILAVPHNISALPSLGAFILPNAAILPSTPLTKFLVPTAVVERAAGLIFYDKLGTNKDNRFPGLCTVTSCSVH